MKNIFLHSLIVENYRNFKNLELKTDNIPITIIGENGSGKTNILEAISLFYPGRGLRSAGLLIYVESQKIIALLGLYCKVSLSLQSLAHKSNAYPIEEQPNIIILRSPIMS